MSTLSLYPRVDPWFLRCTLQLLDRADRRAHLLVLRWAIFVLALAFGTPQDVFVAILGAFIVRHVLQWVCCGDDSCAEAQANERVAARSQHCDSIWPCQQPPSRWRGVELRGKCDWFSLPFYFDGVFQTLLRGWRIGISDVRASYATEQREFDYRSDEDFWFDWVADTGDGFDPSLAVAQLLAQGLMIDGLDLPRGRLLVHGGDLCYPFPQDMARFTDIMELAAPEKEGEDRPDLFIIPGNHEWADGLELFDRLLKRSNIGGWKLPQTSSYFALRVSGWLVYALDMVEEADMPDLDEAQFTFFEEHARRHPSERVLILTHVPEYVKTSCLGMKAFERLDRLKGLLGDRLLLHIAGDVHYYRRYEAEGPSPCTMLISGGGGAVGHGTFLPEATHVKSAGRSFASAACYPTVAESERVFSRKILTTVQRGPVSYLGIFYAGMVAAIAPAPVGHLSELALGFWSQSTSGSCVSFHASVLTLLAIHYTMQVCSESGGVKFMVRSALLTLVHTCAHVAACFALRIVLELVWRSAMIDNSPVTLSVYRISMLLAMHFIGGWIGMVLYNIYFYVACLFFQAHWAEGHSYIGHEGHKSFLRMRVTPRGDLDVYAVGLDTVPQQWIAGDAFTPVEPLSPHLIEHLHFSACQEGDMISCEQEGPRQRKSSRTWGGA